VSQGCDGYEDRWYLWPFVFVKGKEKRSDHLCEEILSRAMASYCPWPRWLLQRRLCPIWDFLAPGQRWHTRHADILAVDNLIMQLSPCLDSAYGRQRL
jgi:hypothetical protein